MTGHNVNDFYEYKCCVLIATYNNASTLEGVIRDVLSHTHQVLVINDGSTDQTATVLGQFPELQVINFPVNKGKGIALRAGFREAVRLGYDYAITIDSDGQHFADDIPGFFAKLQEQPGALIVGARNMAGETIPGKSSFGHKVSNFWFRFETGIDLPDTQCGFRLYPVREIVTLKFFTSRYEFEIEVLVKAAWKLIPIVSVPVKVFYGKERVTHFRPFMDFTRVGLLNVWLVILTVLWQFPKRFFYRIKKKISERTFAKRFSTAMNPPA